MRCEVANERLLPPERNPGWSVRAKAGLTGPCRARGPEAKAGPSETSVALNGRRRYQKSYLGGNGLVAGESPQPGSTLGLCLTPALMLAA